MHEIDPCESSGICIVSVQLGFLRWEVVRKYVRSDFGEGSATRIASEKVPSELIGWFTARVEG